MLALGFALALLAGTARAAPPPLETSLTGEAKTRYEHARSLYQSGAYDDALAELQRAQTLSPDPRLFWNMAACEKKLRRYARAIEHVEKYLQTGGALVSDVERKEANEFVSAIRVFVAEVRVTSNVDGASLYIDDDLAGTTPFAGPIPVDEGDHRVRVKRALYKDLSRAEKVPGGKQLTWALDLEKDDPPPKPPPKKAPLPLAPLLVGAGGLVVGAAGGVLLGLSLKGASNVESSCSPSCAPSEWEGYRTEQRVGDVLIGVGAVAFVGAVVWLLLTPSPATVGSR
jgi:hypothetical protein